MPFFFKESSTFSSWLAPGAPGLPKWPENKNIFITAMIGVNYFIIRGRKPMDGFMLQIQDLKKKFVTDPDSDLSILEALLNCETGSDWNFFLDSVLFF